MASVAGKDVAFDFPLTRPQQQRATLNFQILSGFFGRQPSGLNFHKINASVGSLAFRVTGVGRGRR